MPNLGDLPAYITISGLAPRAGYLGQKCEAYYVGAPGDKDPYLAFPEGIAEVRGNKRLEVLERFNNRFAGTNKDQRLTSTKTSIEDAVKPTDATDWTIYEVIGWRLRWNDTAMVIRHRQPDVWFGSKAELYADKRGAGVDDLIKRIDAAAKAYPYAGEYTLWPGPNSNTFTAWIGRAVPELGIDLPATAIGKDFTGTRIFSRAPIGRGVQMSLGGLFGFAASGVEGIELNLLSLNFGISGSGLKLPLIGRIGSPSFPAAVAEPAAP